MACGGGGGGEEGGDGGGLRLSLIAVLFLFNEYTFNRMRTVVSWLSARYFDILY